MLVTLATRTFIPELTTVVLRPGALARASVAGGDRARALASRLALSAANDARRLADGGVDAGGDSGLVEVRRAPILRDRTGAVRGYVSYMSFNLPLVARLLAGPRPDVVVSEPPPAAGVAVRIAYVTHRVPYVYYCADIVLDAAVLAGVPGLVVCTVVGPESFAPRGARRVIAVSDGVVCCVHDMGAHDVAVVPNGVRVPEAVAIGTPEGLPTCGGSVLVYVGIVAQWLALEVFVDAFRCARARPGGARLVSVGQGSGWDALAERSRGVAGVEMIPAANIEEADRWMVRATATLASLRPGGYDYAYPTKILASLAQGIPVIYAGSGQTARDIAEGELGVACNPNAGEVAEAMVGLTSGTAAQVGAEGARAWVSMYRSVEASSRATTVVVRSVLV